MDTLEKQKLDAMKELAYGASHEINNPLANISARAQSLLKDEPHPERRRALEAIHQQAMRAHEMISDLMLYARPPALQLDTLELDKLVQNVVREMADECHRLNIQAKLDLPEKLHLVGDYQQLQVAVAAVFLNAIEAIGQDGVIKVSAQCKNETWMCLTISDTGAGITEEVRLHMFEPFYSGREAGRGLGFGLSKCWRIVTDHGGNVTAENGVELGATITLKLPVAGPKER